MAVAASMSNLAEIHWRMGELAVAQSLHRECLDIRVQILGEMHPDVAVTLFQIGQLCLMQGQVEEAGGMLTRCLHVRRVYFGDLHRSVVEAEVAVAQLLSRRNRYLESEFILRKTLATSEQLDGQSTLRFTYDTEASWTNSTPLVSLDTALVLDNLSDLLVRVAVDAPEGVTGQCSQQFLDLYGEQGWDAMQVYLDGQYEKEAVREESEAGAAVTRMIGWSRGALEEHMLERRREERLAEAQDISQRALRGRQSQLGEDHPEVADNILRVADIALLRRRYAEACGLYKLGLVIRERRFGEIDPRTVTAMSRIATCLRYLGKLEEARTLFEQCTRCYQRRYDENHVRVASAMKRLADLLKSLEEYDEAEQLYERVLTVRKNEYPAEHVLIAVSERALGELCLSQGRLVRAQELFRSAISIYTHTLEWFQSRQGGDRTRDGDKDLGDWSRSLQESLEWDADDSLYVGWSEESRLTAELALCLDGLAASMESTSAYVTSLLGDLSGAASRQDAREEANIMLYTAFHRNMKGLLLSRHLSQLSDMLMARGKARECKLTLDLALRILRYGVKEGTFLVDRYILVKRAVDLYRQYNYMMESKELESEMEELSALITPEMVLMPGKEVYCNGNGGSSSSGALIVGDSILISKKME